MENGSPRYLVSAGWGYPRCRRPVGGMRFDRSASGKGFRCHCRPFLPREAESLPALPVEHAFLRMDRHDRPALDRVRGAAIDEASLERPGARRRPLDGCGTHDLHRHLGEGPVFPKPRERSSQRLAVSDCRSAVDRGLSGISISIQHPGR